MQVKHLIYNLKVTKMESGPKLAFHNELPMWTIMLVVHFLIDLSYAYTKHAL
jgi:hypothetical protein